MSYQFDIKKAEQVVAQLLKQAPDQRLNYTALLKMLYLADRESIAETGTPITGDRPYAMKLGPVLTNIFNLISQSDWQDEDTISHWNSFFETIDYDLILKNDPGEDELSDYEIDKLKKIFEQHGKKHYKQLVKETHRLPEWKTTFKHRATDSVLISIHDILRAVGREEDFDAIQDEMQEDARLDKLFSE